MVMPSPSSSSNNHPHQELNLPHGFTFSPSDSELIEFYLIPKLNGLKLPSDYVVDLENIYDFDPHQLPYKEFKYAKENESFFFTKDEMWKRCDEGGGGGEIRATPGGYWKVYQDPVGIKSARDDEFIGFKTKLFFHDNVDGNLTDWKMNEFRCHPSRIPTTSTSENYIACKIKLRSKEVDLMSTYPSSSGGEDYEVDNRSDEDDL